MGVSKNSKFAKMRGAEKIVPHNIKDTIRASMFFRSVALGMKSGFLEVP